MPDNPNSDPFTRGYDAIQSALAAWPAWAALVKPGNRINQRVLSPVPRKEDAEDSDWPEFALGVRAFSGAIFDKNSLACSFGCDYPLQIASGAATTEVLC